MTRLACWVANPQTEGLFESLGASERGRRWVPPIDLVASGEEIILTADLPGLREDEIAIEVKDGVLRISGEREFAADHSVEGYYRFERVQGSFSRSVALPKGVDPAAVSAGYENGVLEVRIPKPAERQPHKITVAGPRPAAIEAQGSEAEAENQA